jgi:hypothetical protein
VGSPLMQRRLSARSACFRLCLGCLHWVWVTCAGSGAAAPARVAWLRAESAQLAQLHWAGPDLEGLAGLRHLRVSLADRAARLG